MSPDTIGAIALVAACWLGCGLLVALGLGRAAGKGSRESEVQAHASDLHAADTPDDIDWGRG